jgi:TfoX/Sxy family transcriptional regulator of competence genes
MHIPSPADADKDRFRDLVPPEPGVQVKAMFGNLGAFVNGNMFAGLFGPTIGVKLGHDDRLELTVAGGGPFGPEGRPMGGYLTLPQAILDQPDEAAAWIHRALQHVAAMPPKQPKTKKPR